MIKPKRIDKSSLKIGLLRVIVLGIMLAIAVYTSITFISEYYRTNVYVKEENRKIREARLLEDFQDYVNDREISSDDQESIRNWVQQKTYVYLLFYKGDVKVDELIFFSGMHDNTNMLPLFSNLLLGGSIDYPSEEEMLEHAKENGFVKVKMADGIFLVSITEFSEYFYIDVARTLAIGLALFSLALVITIYFFKVVKRITKLAFDVTVVADGDMNYSIHADGSDEISKLSHDIENMRTAMLSTLNSEREAREANTELITSMSHDIRTPLTVLIGYLDIMKMYSSDEMMNEYIKRSEGTAMRLKKLSDDMFKYLLVFGEGAEPYELEEYDGATLIDQLLSEHAVLLCEQGYNVRINSPVDTDVTILTSAPGLMRIVDNVFSNIRKYADKEQPVSISVEVGEDKVYMTFSNKIARDISTAESTGIGLKTCAKIAELISSEFTYSKNENIFIARVRLVSQRRKKA